MSILWLFGTIKKGSSGGHSRYYCKSSERYFTDRRPHISERNMFPWFERWVRDKQSIEQIAKASGYSERTLKRYFYKTLPTCPTWHIQRREEVNLHIDGTYFTNKVCLVAYRDSNIKITILYRLSKGEVFPGAIIQRCTFHVACQVELWLTKKPQSEAAQDLLDLVRLLNGGESQE